MKTKISQLVEEAEEVIMQTSTYMCMYISITKVTDIVNFQGA